jgi:hypothetical protein
VEGRGTIGDIARALRPSWVFPYLRFFRCGAIISMPYSRRAASRGSES